MTGRKVPILFLGVIWLEYMGTKEASARWNIPQNSISQMCRAGKIKGAEQDKPKSPWRIPINTERPDYKPRNKK